MRVILIQTCAVHINLQKCVSWEYENDFLFGDAHNLIKCISNDNKKIVWNVFDWTEAEKRAWILKKTSDRGL